MVIIYREIVHKYDTGYKDVF